MEAGVLGRGVCFVYPHDVDLCTVGVYEARHGSYGGVTCY